MAPELAQLLDWLAGGTYVVVILGLGMWATRRNATAEEYFLAGRSLPGPVVGLSLFATNISGSSVVGLMGGAYHMGLAIYNYEWTAVVILVLFILFFLPVYRRTQITTVPEFLERRFDVRARRYFSGLMVISIIVIEMAGSLYAGAVVIRAAYPAISMGACVAGTALVVGIYAVAGGFRAVAYTDVLQAVLLLIGTGVIAVVAYHEVGGWEAVAAATPERMRHLLLPADSEVLPWPGLLTGIVLLGLYYWCINQVTVQRTLAARSLGEARRGALLAGALKLPVLFFLVMPGLFAYVLYPTLENPDLVFPTLAFDLLPAGLRGLVLVAFAAAVMSSVDSILNSAATLLTVDFYAEMRPDVSDRHLVTAGRVLAGVVLVLGAAMAPQVAHFPSLWTYLQAALAYVMSPVVAVVGCGLFWQRANRHGALAALAGGSALGVALLAWQPALHFLYVAVLLFAASLILLVGVSVVTAVPPPDKVAACHWRRDDAILEPGTRWALIALLATVGLVVGVFL